VKPLLLLTALFALLSGCGDGSPTSNNAAESISDSRDGNTYRAVKMPDGRVWMAENLNYAGVESWAYDNSEANAAIYGRLYTWEAAKVACPEGWKLPGGGAWAELIRAAGGKNMDGKRLKAKSGWNDGRNGTDNYGFSALPGGVRHDQYRTFELIGTSGYWWTADKRGEGTANICMDSDFYQDRCSSYSLGSSAYSVRCIRD